MLDAKEEKHDNGPEMTIRQALAGAELLSPAEAAAQLCAIAQTMSQLQGAEYMESFARASGFDIELLKLGHDAEVERYWEQYAILGILRPLLCCNKPQCHSYPLLSLHEKLKHMEHYHGWTGQDAAAWLNSVAKETAAFDA